MEFIQIEVTEREASGSSAMKHLRRAGAIPGVLYGLKRRNLPLTIPVEELDRFLRTGSHLVELKMGDATRDAILREVQVDPVSDQILHVDFIRVEKDAEIEDQVPITYKGHAKGTTEGGLFQALMDHLKLRARPRDLPREILIEIAHMVVGDEVHLRDIALPAGVSLVDDPDELVAHVVAQRGLEVDEVEAEEAAEGAEPAPTEPEVIGKGEKGEGE